MPSPDPSPDGKTPIEPIPNRSAPDRSRPDQLSTDTPAGEESAGTRPTAGSTVAKVETVVNLARRQHGVVSYKQLRDVGLSPHQVRTRVNRGEWSRVFRGVYRLGGAPVTWEAQLRAHLLAAGDEAVASHRTAAVLHGLEGFHQATPEISVPPGRNYRLPGVRVHRVADLDLVSFDRRSGCPTTRPARTLLDLAAVVRREKLHAAVEDAIRRDLVSWDGLIASLATHARKGRPGVSGLRDIVDEHRDEVRATENGFELLVASVLQQAGLPRPEAQHEVAVDDSRYRIDLAYPVARVAIELDGSRHREKATFETDRTRQNALILAGWTVLRYTWDHYVRQRTRVIREVRTALDGPAPA